jgi:hypothetical protein
MQSKSIHFDSVIRLRNPFSAQLPDTSLTQSLTFINLRESVFNIGVY